MSGINLYCFPHAGGGAAAFRTWVPELAPRVHLQPVVLPGRGARLSEPILQSFDEAFRYLRDEVVPAAVPPFAFYGHSMGALLAFEAAREVERRRNAPLLHLFVSGSSAPQFGPRPPLLRHLDDDAFIERIQTLGGTPPEILRNRELVELVLPILRADFAVAETYTYEPRTPLRAPISVWGGHEDEPTEAELGAWREVTTSRCLLRMLPGGHFFVHSARDQLLRALRGDLEETLQQTRGAGNLADGALDPG